LPERTVPALMASSMMGQKRIHIRGVATKILPAGAGRANASAF